MGKILEAFAVEKALSGNRSYERNSEFDRLMEKFSDSEKQLLIPIRNKKTSKKQPQNP